MPKLCPCGSHKSYSGCCEPYLSSQKTAPTPEALMRSRYSAFTKRKFSYLVKTMKGEAAQAFDITAARKDALLIKWLKLEVIRSETQGDMGVVEFKAYYQYNGKPSVLHEASQFEKENGKWFYVCGQHR